MNNPPLSLRLEASPGADIGDCFDHALDLARHLNVVVNFDFNGVECGVRPCDFGAPRAKEVFVGNYHHEIATGSGLKICYANP